MRHLQQPAKEPAEDKRTPYQRFEDLARKIVAVPKSEIDELRAKDPRGPRGKQGDKQV